MVTENIIDLFHDDLKEFFDFNKHIDMLSSSEKYDDFPRHVYLTDIKQDYLTLAPNDNSIIIKELTYEQALIYHKISQTFHPHLETVYCVLEREGHFISISEFIKAPDCLDYEQRSISLEESVAQFGNFSERDALIYICQLCDGIEALHKLNLTHNDISPKNILLTNAPAWEQEISLIPPASQRIWMKLIDFDISKEQKKWNHSVTTVMGTAPYAAPEILDFMHPTNRVDIYSLGCVLYYMLTGQSPKDTAMNAHKKQFRRNTMQLIHKCTTSYENRYKNVSELKTAALRGIQMLDSRLPKLIWHIPGFRSHTYWKMTLALTYYSCLIAAPLGSGYPFPSISVILISLIQVVILLIIFDIFHLEDKVPIYAHWKNTYPRLELALKIFIILLILIVSYNLGIFS
ncbi:protein kinase [Lachnospiraceae bacterium MD335]|nr:protein kinase [Lachnospiraceae bacterium MD335]